MNKFELLALAVAASAFYLWHRFSTRDERRAKAEKQELELKRTMLGIRAGVGSSDEFHSSASTGRRRCPRGVCTTPGASCPCECIEEPRVIRHNDGRRSHVYPNVTVEFAPGGKLLGIQVTGKNWQ